MILGYERVRDMYKESTGLLAEVADICAYGADKFLHHRDRCGKLTLVKAKPLS